MPTKPVRKSLFETHPRAAETRQAMLEARIDDEQEVMDLQSSELACELADAWVGDNWGRDTSRPELLPILRNALNKLELITRPSAMRKVRP